MASKGAKERANSAKGQVRRPNLDRYYSKKAAAIRPGDFDFRTKLIRLAVPAKEERIVELDPNLTSVTWSDEGDTYQASLTLRRPFRLRPGGVPVSRGDGVRVEFRWAGKWRELWTLWVQGEPEVNLSSGEVSCELADELFPLKKNQREWEFKKSKAGPHRKGWTADEVARHVCKTERVRIGKLAKGTKRFEIKKMKKASGLEVIRKAYAEEANKSGRKFLIHIKDGKLNVLPLERPEILYVLRGVALEASTAAAAKNESPATVVEAKGRLKGEKGKDAKLKLTVARTAAVKRFGRVVQEKDFGRVDSEDDLRTQAKRYLAEQLKVTRTATIEVPGIPFLEKGSTVRWITAEPGWHGKTTLAKHPRDKSIAFITSAQHSLTPESYTTSVEISQEDVYYATAEKEDEDARNAKRQERKSAQKDSKKEKEEGETE